MPARFPQKRLCRQHLLLELLLLSHGAEMGAGTPEGPGGEVTWSSSDCEHIDDEGQSSHPESSSPRVLGTPQVAVELSRIERGIKMFLREIP